jgi:hypothetical protein
MAALAISVGVLNVARADAREDRVQSIASGDKRSTFDQPTVVSAC